MRCWLRYPWLLFMGTMLPFAVSTGSMALPCSAGPDSHSCLLLPLTPLPDSCITIGSSSYGSSGTSLLFILAVLLFPGSSSWQPCLPLALHPGSFATLAPPPANCAALTCSSREDCFHWLCCLAAVLTFALLPPFGLALQLIATIGPSCLQLCYRCSFSWQFRYICMVLLRQPPGPTL